MLPYVIRLASSTRPLVLLLLLLFMIDAAAATYTARAKRSSPMDVRAASCLPSTFTSSIVAAAAAAAAAAVLSAANGLLFCAPSPGFRHICPAPVCS
jgi:hypothetical protein